MSDYLVHPPVETPILSHQSARRRLNPFLAVEAGLAWGATGWAVVGVWTHLAHPKSPAGNAFGAAAQFVGSWKVLVALQAFTAVALIAGLVTGRGALRRVGLGSAAFVWAFVASGLSSLGFISTAVVIYPMLSALAIVAWFHVPSTGSRRDR